jgi:LuxR family transcriptional regulator, quorum-sensing system regulator SdiA
MTTDDGSAPDVTETVSAILAALDVTTAWEAYRTAVARTGFDHIIYGGTRLPTTGILGDLRDALILHHGPTAYLDIYLGEELYLHSPTYAWAEHNSGFVSWSEALAAVPPKPTPQMLRIAQLNAQFDVFAGYVGSLNDVVPGMRGVIGLSPGNGMHRPEVDALWKVHGRQIEMLSRLIQLRIASLPQAGQRRPLTNRQREALVWSSRGKTMQDVATIMGLSIATVEKHLRMAREALDAQTTAHAVQKAVLLNLLSEEA